MLYELPATKLHPKGRLRIETDLDQEPSGLTDALPATRSTLRNPRKFPFYFNEIDASNNFVALPFHRLDWMRYLARKKPLESEA
jgi:hypothetical protein